MRALKRGVFEMVEGGKSGGVVGSVRERLRPTIVAVVVVNGCRRMYAVPIRSRHCYSRHRCSPSLLPGCWEHEEFVPLEIGSAVQLLMRTRGCLSADSREPALEGLVPEPRSCVGLLIRAGRTEGLSYRVVERGEGERRRDRVPRSILLSDLLGQVLLF